MKLFEEVKEYQENRDAHELADIIEIIEALLTLHKISFRELQEIKYQKRKERGAFTKRIKLHSIMIVKQ